LGYPLVMRRAPAPGRSDSGSSRSWSTVPRSPTPGRQAIPERTTAAPPGSRIVAMLGPTNTGKTHRALERMLEHPTGMIGLPLRLLAREVYDRVSARVGEGFVALITGEEKRIGKQARYWICTVEAMPLDRVVDFLAVDEIQLAEHPTRGHVFTDRLLHARGRIETWFLGAETIRPLLELVLPTAVIERRPRLSQLSARDQTSLGALPARSAVVAFSVPEVYRLADGLRRRRGGAAVVLGALSPRARNAQVALYEAKEVDYLVATDAIGMGLNLAIRHVAFASLRKFDGRLERPLTPAELGQVAGRAGRHLENGSFGTLAPLPPLHPTLKSALEQHRFERIDRLVWRNSELDFASLDDLLASLRRDPPRRYLRRVAQSSDLLALERLQQDAAVRERAHGADALELLWSVCQIPDYDQGLAEQHSALIKRVFLQLTGPASVLDDDWLERSLAPLDDVEGDLDALTWRIAAVRTWTYLSNHAAWVRDAAHWRARTQGVEDRLSDALHARLVERFVERRRGYSDLGAASVESPDKLGARDDRSPFRALVQLRERMLGTSAASSPDIWLEEVLAAPHESFELDVSGNVSCSGRLLARVSKGVSLLRPEVKLVLEGVSAGQNLRLSRRLLAWTRDLVEEILAPLRQVDLGRVSPSGRGLLYQLEQSLGTLAARDARAQLAGLSGIERSELARARIHLGRDVVYAVASVRPRELMAREMLCRAFAPEAMSALNKRADAGSFAVRKDVDATLLASLGYPPFGSRAVRADIARRITRHLADRQAAQGEFALPTLVADWLGMPARELPALLRSFGYRQVGHDRFARRSRKASNRREPTHDRREPLPRDESRSDG
jgi:ATP-dependent RNA helicase SUPV3L1/SUV3